MNLTNEQLKLIEVLKESDAVYTFPRIEQDCDSYFEGYESDVPSISKFSFASITELMCILGTEKRTVRSKKCDALCAIEIFKNKPEYDEKRSCNKQDNNMEIPEYIYNF